MALSISWVDALSRTPAGKRDAISIHLFWGDGGRSRRRLPRFRPIGRPIGRTGQRRAARHRPGRRPHPEIDQALGVVSRWVAQLGAETECYGICFSQAAAARSPGGARRRGSATCTATSTRRPAGASGSGARRGRDIVASGGARRTPRALAGRRARAIFPGSRYGSRIRSAGRTAGSSRRSGGDIETGRALDAERLQRNRVGATADQNIRLGPRPPPWLALWPPQNCRPARTVPAPRSAPTPTKSGIRPLCSRYRRRTC